MTSDPHRVALERRRLARQAVSDAAAVSERLLAVHRRALTLLGPDENAADPEEIGTRMRLIEQRMLDVEKLMRDAERSVPPPDEEPR